MAAAQSVLAVMALLLCLGVMAAAILFDVTARIIPRQLCWALAAAGAAFQASAHGVAGVVVGIGWAALLCAAALMAAWVARGRGAGAAGASVAAPIGAGDVRCMAALGIVSGAGAPVGFVACFSCALVWAIAMRVRRRLLPGEGFVFAPFLAIWLAVGVAVA